VLESDHTKLSPARFGAATDSLAPICLNKTARESRTHQRASYLLDRPRLFLDLTPRARPLTPHDASVGDFSVMTAA
jgi:hypothetical protein